MKSIALNTLASHHVAQAEDHLLALETAENRIIGAAITEAYAAGWSLGRRVELVSRLNEQVRDIHGHERMAHLQTIHDGGRADAEGLWADARLERVE